MSFYEEMAASTAEILAEFGAAATLKRTATGAYDPATQTAAVTTTSQAVTAAVFDYNQHYIDGSLIKTGDKQVYLSAVGVAVPLAGDVLTWQAGDYAVISVKPLAPAGISVLYEIQVRK